MPKKLLAAAAAAVLVPIAALAHDDGKGNIIMPAFELLQQEFSNVVAANANPKSNAPKGFAPCINGMAAKTYPCDGVDMMSHLDLTDLNSVFVNDIWGWTDPLTRRDYALVGQAEGVTIVDITDPKRPEIIGLLPARFDTANIIWRDMKVYQDHMYVVSEDLGSGLQVMDLRDVRAYKGSPLTFSAVATRDDYNHSHNIAINEATGYAYVIGADICNGGLVMYDISTPDNPVYSGCGSNTYVHDTQCVIYSGPDSAYSGREICFNSAAEVVAGGFSPATFRNTLEIVDVTDKAAPVQLGEFEYPLDGYSHQGWLSSDQSVFFHNDELDEFSSAFSFPELNTTTRIFDVSDLTNPGLINAVDHGTTSIGHNAYTEGDHLFAANYTTGLRVYDTSVADAGHLPELAWFDVYPENDNNTFEGGAWSSYPFFRQKKIVAVSSSERGLFVLRPRIGN